jgi:FAD/FMN-containing dehydrogenase
MAAGISGNTEALEDLRDGFAGSLVTPDDPSYDEARSVFNGMIDRRPAVIAQCASPEDVAKAILFGRHLGLQIAVRGGGHSVSGMSLNDGGIVIDLRRMNAVTVDPEARTARVAGGATMSELASGTRARSASSPGSARRTTGGSRRSRAGTTRRTSSGSTTTSSPPRSRTAAYRGTAWAPAPREGRGRICLSGQD